jgi:hypothetical protein
MDVSQELPVNHHAEHPGFSGITGALFGLMFLVIGRSNARLAVDVAGVTDTDRVVDAPPVPHHKSRPGRRPTTTATFVPSRFSRHCL